MNARAIRTSIAISAVLTVAAPVATSAAVGVADLFVLSDRCMACHNNLVAPDGLDVSIGSNWRASMMAHSARDPYWQASVRREILDHPSAAPSIEDECATCHMPMSRYGAKVAGGHGEVFANLPASAAVTAAARLAVAGVSCTACHQITDKGLGERQSFVGGFVIDSSMPLGARRVFGPFDVDQGRERIMRSASRFVPKRADHVQSSELCATCHTLYTHVLDENGEVVGELPEQVPYLEWLHSDYGGARSCQSCHMPVVEGEMPITGVLGQPRNGFSRHVFRGGNFLMPRIFNRFADELTPQALPEELDTASRRTAEHLRSAAGRIGVGEARVGGTRLHLEVAVDNLAGHKLPTAYPSRRAWVHLEVRDRRGETVFESGSLRPDGSIVGNDNDADPTRYEPHYSEISSSDQVQVYEAIMADQAGRVTTGLLRAVRFIKDNRILPIGFDPATAGDDIAVRGAAGSDSDFTGGSDRLRFVVPLGEAAGPYRVVAELWYQPVAFRWARNLAPYGAGEPERFVRYFDELSSSSGTILARDSSTAE
jgi:hypothetical protein